MKLVILAVIGLFGAISHADFVLRGDEQLTVNTNHSSGTLYDQSGVSVIDPAWVSSLVAYDSSTIDLTSGYVYRISANQSSTTNIAGGTVGEGISADGISTVHVSAGSAGRIRAHEDAVVNISGGSTGNLYAYDTSSYDITGGTMYGVHASDAASVMFSGGAILQSSISAEHTSTVTLITRNLLIGRGLSIDGTRVLGTGFISGEWYNGERWAANIFTNTPKATIRVLPEPTNIGHFGDADLSGYVDDDDLSLLLANWNSGTTWGQGDFNLSGNVNDHDLSLLLANWGAGVPAPSAIPEPATLLLLIGGFVWIRRR